MREKKEMKGFGRAVCIITAAAMSAVSLPTAVFAEETDNSAITVRNVIFTNGGLGYRIDGVEDICDRTEKPAAFSARRAASLPEKFDPRENSAVTAVKDQSTTAICWAFASLSCIEQNLILKGYENASVDFSEASLAYVSAFADSASDSPFDTGGNWINAAVSLSIGKGLCYDDYEPLIPDDFDEMVISDYKTDVCEYQPKSIQRIDGSIGTVKNKILECGAVTVNYWVDDEYMSKDGNNYFDPQTDKHSDANHSVSVIGWDDNYSRENFRENARPQSDGAWLVKGSWGAFNQDGGYYWISYEEAELCDWCAYDMEERSDNTYYHADSTDSMVYMDMPDGLYAANVFTAESDECLNRIGFLNICKAQALDYTATVYTSVSDSSPVGAKEISVNGTISGDGFYTVDLPKAVRLEKGEKFSVVICFEDSDNEGGFVAESLNVSHASSGESYYSVDGIGWTDVTDDDSVCANVYINAYTEDVSEPDKEELESLAEKYGGTVGMEKETDNAKRVLNDKSADKTDVENAELLIKAAVEENDEYLVITSEKQWRDFARRVCEGENFAGKTVTLESDLDFGGESVSPVGNDKNTFGGCFDGNGHVIKNAVFEGNVYGGVFSIADGYAQIKNLTAVNCSVSARYAGGIVGSQNSPSLRSCGFSGTLSGSESAGGIAGRIGKSSVTECFSYLSAESSENARAFIGEIYSDETVPDITYCFSDTLFKDDLYKNGSLPDFDKSAAYDLNTFGGAQTDSGKWTMENGFPKQTRPDEEPSHKVTFEAMGQKLYGYSDKNGNVKFPVINVQNGYAITWYDGERPVYENTVFIEDSSLTAKASPTDKSVITYVLNGGGNNPENLTELGKGETLALSDPTKEGADFAGWYADPQLSGEKVTSVSADNGSTVLYAAWKPYTYTVRFADSDGTVLDVRTVEYGESAKAPQLSSPDGKRFSGWDKDFSSVKEDMTVTAVYTDRRMIYDCRLSGFRQQVSYNAGGAVQSDLKIYFGNEQLKANVDYFLTYCDNNKLGTARVTIIGQGVYSGIMNLKYEVVPKDCSSLAFSYGSVCAFTGKAITPSVTVKDGTMTLVKGRDYSVSYQSNVKVGTGKIIITFKGNYKGTVTKNFTINPAKQEIQTLETRYKGFYIDYVRKGSATGYEINGSLSSGFSGAKAKRVTTNKTDKLTVSGLSAGKKYYVRVRSYTVNGGKTYYGAWSPVKTVTTARYNLASAKISGIASKTYTGKAVTQSVKVKYGSKTLKNGTDYTVKYSSNVKVGTAKLIITGKGSYGGVVTKSFNINPAKQTIQKLSRKKGGFYIDYAQKGSATGYEISYARSSRFSGAGKVKVTNNRTDKKNVTGLKRYTKYYVRVRSYTVVKGKTYYGAWSSAKTVTTG